ncbi:hypothetical protein FT663_04138 [Candidozyma haemuli var. vulneris]|uniref:Trafficking protein particle complex III-specific subunit 85 n=1 Tax=Candidozyma haemuli TaxID=45357 RepID=A0A2V1AN20_9ASCO|nr:hypothetical protein CXQ85_003517 [[Candida] haemuloni]KAF3987428.1 hypothetical protein FT662_03993 [[Candida] haemuloni var. vulneris]KAF3988192.1 hypothetical protein FT663_04138 [[Candida] haemuloni var. vulneris]PVH19667.1 hypothetical protein CXQ85_003517 [[Candida] haemuloni]
MPFPSGTDPTTVRQLLLQHNFSPLVSVQSTHNADVLFQRQCLNDSVSVLQVLKPYGNNAKYSVPNQRFKITNSALITRTYSSFPVRFEPSLPELLSVHNADTSSSSEQLKSLFSISSLELLLKSSNQASSISARSHDKLYLEFFRMVISSNQVVSFDTLNHPVSQIFVIDYHTDTLETLRKLIVDFRNYNFPKYFQISDLLIHIFVVYDSQMVSEQDVSTYQTNIQANLSVSSTAVPLSMVASNDTAYVKLSKLESATIEEEVQSVQLQHSKELSDNDLYLKLPKALDTVLKSRCHDFISRFLIPHMEAKLRIWGDQILAPKKSIAGRFFSVSRKLFNNNSSSDLSQTQQSQFNHKENFYHRSSNEQAIRKLADWSLILKDFKYAYSTYDLIKKDYINDKAWVYVASTQGMCIVSLLLTQTQPLASDTPPQAPDKNTLRKIRHDIIEPYIDNLSYSFKSRLNVKTYAIRAYLVVAELLLSMGMMFNIPWWFGDLIESYYLKCMGEIDSHLASNMNNPQVIRALLYERLGYASSQNHLVPGEFKWLLGEKHEIIPEREVKQDTQEIADEKENEASEQEMYVNEHKLHSDKPNALLGLTRFRKSAAWYLLSMREWLDLKDKEYVKLLMNNVSECFEVPKLTDNWYDRPESLLGILKLKSK